MICLRDKGSSKFGGRAKWRNGEMVYFLFRCAYHDAEIPLEVLVAFLLVVCPNFVLPVIANLEVEVNVFYVNSGDIPTELKMSS